MTPTDEFDTSEALEEIREKRRWLIPLSILLIALGFAALFAAFAATVVTVVFFGAVLIVGGVAQIGQSLADRDDDFGWELAGGLLYLLAGGILFFDPLGAAVGLTLLLAIFFLFTAIARLTHGFRMRQRGTGGGMLLAAGALDLLLGILIMVGWPGSAAWVIGLFLGIELVFAGVALLSATLGARDTPAVERS